MISALSLLAGVLVGLGGARTPPTAWLLLAGWMVLVVAAVRPARQHRVCRCLAAGTLGFCLANLELARWEGLVVQPGSSDTRLLLEVRVTEPPARRATDLMVEAQVQVLDGSLDRRLRRARLAWRDAPRAPRAGERWRLLVRVGSVTDTRNFSGLERSRLALRDRVHLVARVLPSSLNTRLALAPASVDTLRARIAARIGDAVADPDAAGLLSALAVGLTADVSADQWRVFNATGTTHLVAISGLHVTLFAWLAFAAARFSWCHLRPVRRLTRETFAALAGLACAGGYAWLAGFSVPTQRTWLMLAIFAGARLCARAQGAARPWSLAMVGVLLLDPLAPLAAGFWLSFVAVGVLLMFDHARLARAAGQPTPRWRQAVRLQWAITLMLAPFTVAVFGGISVAGLVVNLLAIPAVSFGFVPLVLAGAVGSLVTPSAGAPFFRAAAWAYEQAWPALVAAADLDFALWRVMPPAAWYGFAFVAAALSLCRWPTALRATGLVALLPLLFTSPRPPPPGSARVEILDAGRGASIVISTASRVVVFDTGDSWGSKGSRAGQIVAPALTRSVDRLILPVLDPDRAAGAAWLTEERGVGVIVVSDWPGTSLPVRHCRDQSLVEDGVRFEFLAAGDGGRYCALRVVAGGSSVLVGGDLDAAAERQIVARLGADRLATDLVIMNRGASERGSAPQWIEATRAGLVIATGGSDGESRRRAKARWQARGARLLDTRTDGAIVAQIGPRGLEILAIANRSRYPFAWRRLP